MKMITLSLLSLLVYTGSFAINRTPGPDPISLRTSGTSKALGKIGLVRLQFRNVVTVDDRPDSVLVIFDRYDHSGPGVVYSIFALDVNNGITVPAVPEGKYFVTVECKGLHREHLEMLVTVKARKIEQVHLKLDAVEAYNKEKVRIPVFKPDMRNMAIFQDAH